MRKLQNLLIICLIIGISWGVKLKEQSHLGSGDAADLLQEHLDGIQTDIREEQYEHQTLYESQHAECQDEIAAREQAIADGEDALRQAETHFIRCESAYNEAEADLAQVVQYQTSIKANLQQLEITRNQEKEDLRVLIEEELDPAIAAVEGAFPILDEFSSGSTSFLEVSKHMGKTFKHMVKSGKGGNMAGVLTALVALGSGQFSQSDLDQIRTLFQNLLDDLNTAKNTAIENENQRQELYDATVAEFESILTRLESTQNELTEYSNQMAACQVQEQAIIDEASAKVRNNKQALDNALEMCTAFETEYENASAGRKAEIELLSKLSQFIEEQSEIFGEYGADSTGVLDSFSQDSSSSSFIQEFVQTRSEKRKAHLDKISSALPKNLRKNY